MAEELDLPQSGDKESTYECLIPQIKAVIADEENLTANLANIAAILHQAFRNLWTGFYISDGETLVLGPFQGPLACTRIPVFPAPQGVCGTSAFEQKTLVVPDVDKFPGHIACSSASRSEIVVPLVTNSGKTALVLDIDSTELNHFDDLDKIYCERILELVKVQHF